MAKQKTMELKHQLEKASNYYTDNTVLRALINGIPYVGGSIDVLLSNRAQKIAYDRVLNFINEIKIEFNNTKEEMINKDFLESEEFFDLITNCISIIVKTRIKEKSLLFSKIIKESVLIEKNHIYEFDDIIWIIDNLSYEDFEFIMIILGSNIVSPEQIRMKGYSPESISKQFPDILIDKCLFRFSKLVSIGLLVRNALPTTHSPEKYRYNITPTMEIIIEYLKGNDAKSC